MAAACKLLAIIALKIGVDLLVARNRFRRCRDSIAHRYKIQVGFVLARIVITQNVIRFDPAFGFCILVLLPGIADQEVRVIGEVAVIDFDRRDVPLVAAY